MGKKNIYVVQFGTGSHVNLLPLAAGQLVARLKQEADLLKKANLCEIIFRREEIVSKLEDVFIIGISCFLWNLNISLQTAKEVRKKFPEALIVTGGPAVPKEIDLLDDFFDKHPYIDIICQGEGEEVFVEICKKHLEEKGFRDVKGIIYKDKNTGETHITPPREEIQMETLPSPYTDGTFDNLYEKYKSEFSGICWETSRGCPFKCSYCTWGNNPYRKVREKPLEQVKEEIEWIGRHKINYIAMADSNFGIRDRDIDLAKMLAECKKEYGTPTFIGMNWVKNSSDKVLKISNILRNAGIGFRVTLSVQSLNEDSLRAINRINIKRKTFEEIRQAYHKARLYSYTEIILGLPMETYESYLDSVEELLSESVFDQICVYPLFLFPNTAIGTQSSRKKYGLQGKLMKLQYPKSKEHKRIPEYVETVVETKAMPKEKWINTFVEGYYTLALHDDRLAFFIFRYLKKTYGVNLTELVTFTREMSKGNSYPLLQKSFRRLENCAQRVQEYGASHLIEARAYGGIPYDPQDAIFLELLLEKKTFYAEFLIIVEKYLQAKSIDYDPIKIRDLFVFQSAVMATPDGQDSDVITVRYNWIDYFLSAFNLEERELKPIEQTLRVVEQNPCHGDPAKFLKNYFDIKGIPAFYELMDNEGNVVFPPVRLSLGDKKEF